MEIYRLEGEIIIFYSENLLQILVNKEKKKVMMYFYP